MFRTVARIVLLVLAAVAVTTTAEAQIKLGILPRLTASEMTKMFAPLAAQLEKELGQPVQIVVPKDFDTFMAMAKAGQFDLAFANPSVYVELRAALAVEPLALAVETGTGKDFTGCFLVKKGSPIKSVADLKGKKVIFVDARLAGGYQVEVLSMQKTGLTHSDLTVLPFANKHTNVALAVQNGVADAGGIRTADFAKIKGLVSVPDVVVLTETPSIPNWPVFAFKKVPADVVARARKALLGMAPKSAAAGILKGAALDGFAATTDADFEAVREMTKAVKAF